MRASTCGSRSPGQDFESGATTSNYAALESAGVEFIAENGGGAGVRLRKAAKMMRSIYVIRSEAGHTKIGTASKPRLRLSTLSTSSPFPLRLDYSAEVHDGDAKILESRAHAILHEHRRNGEWFEVDSGEAVKAVIQAAQELGFRLVMPAMTAHEREQLRVQERIQWFLNEGTPEAGASEK